MRTIGYFFEITPVQPGADILVSELAELDFESFVETNSGLEAYVPEELDREDRVKEILDTYASLGIKGYRRESIEKENWNATWESRYEPVFVGNEFVVRAPFHPSFPNFKTEICILPQMSFGTGHHETTYLMLSLMAQGDLHGVRVLDMGCGTGVLAIAAKLRGAQRALAIDIEDWAYRNTMENAALNKVGIEVRLGDASLLNQESEFDLVLANINKNVLLHDLEFYHQHLAGDGRLMLSGFFTSDLDAILTKAESLGMSQTRMQEKNSWVAVELKKTV
jgi:ribosomal protein L11 methyltransferase